MTELVAVKRPNGKLYRPRKIVAFIFDADPDYPRVLVLGTHDVVRAARLAKKTVVRDYDSGCEPVKPVRGWWRSGIRNHVEWFEQDERHGRAGVSFEIEEIA